MDDSSAGRNRTTPELQRLECVSASVLVAQPPTARRREAKPTVVAGVTKYHDETVVQPLANRQPLSNAARRCRAA